MAIGFLNNIDLNNNQVLNVRLQNLGTAPTGAGAASGSIYFNSAGGVNRPAWHDGTNWYQIYPASATTVNNTVVLRDGSGNATANTFIGTLQGNADQATKLAATKNIGITGKATATAAAFDGSANVNIDITALSIVPGDIGLSSGSFIVGNGSNVGAVTAKSSIPLSGFGDATTNVSLGSNRIISLAEPINASDAATKAYVDAAAVGLKVKDSVNYSTAAALAAYTYTSLAITATANGALTVDGLTPAVNDRILVKNETTTNAKRNGIYTVTQVGSASTPFILTRSTDFDSSAEASPGTFVFVTDGNTLANTGWVMSAPGPITLDTSDIIWSQFSGTGQIDAGDGLTKTGNRIDVVGTAGRISVTANSVDIASTYVGQTSITTLGTITQGTWQGATIQVNQGGTGLTTYNVGSLLYAGGSTIISQLASVAVGSVLISQGGGIVPSWGKVGLTTHVNGILGIGNGGTNLTSVTSNGVLIGSGAAYAFTAAMTAGQILLANASNVPTPTTVTGDITITSGGVTAIGSNKVTVGMLAQLAGASVLGRSSAGTGNVAAITGTSNQVLRVGSTGTLAFGAINLANAAAVSGVLSPDNGGTGLSVIGSANTVLTSNGAGNFPSWNLVNLGTMVTGILAGSNGGTGTQYAQFTTGGSTLRTYSLPDRNAQMASHVSGTLTGDGSTTLFTATHNLNTKQVLCALYDSSDNLVYTDTTTSGLNSVTFTFAVAPSNTSTYRWVVVGY